MKKKPDKPSCQVLRPVLEILDFFKGAIVLSGMSSNMLNLYRHVSFITIGKNAGFLQRG